MLKPCAYSTCRCNKRYLTNKRVIPLACFQGQQFGWWRKWVISFNAKKYASFYDICTYLKPFSAFTNYVTAELTHWGRVTHKCVGKLTSIGSDNGLSPGRRQAIIWTNAGILFIWPLGTNFSEILIAIEAFSFKKIHLKISSAKWRPFCLGLNVLREISI